jgi:hypothetical protein
MIPMKHSFAGECIQALVDNITLPEFQGNIIVIVSNTHCNCVGYLF